MAANVRAGVVSKLPPLNLLCNQGHGIFYYHSESGSCLVNTIGYSLCVFHRVDQKLLIHLIHAIVEQKAKEQKNMTVSLFRALQYKLDFSSQDEIYFNRADCRAISTAIGCASDAELKTQLTIQDCQVEESGMEELFPILNKAIFR